MAKDKKKKAEKKKDVRPRRKTISATMDLKSTIVDRIDTLAEDDLRTRSGFIAFTLLRYIRMRERKVPGISNT